MYPADTRPPSRNILVERRQDIVADQAFGQHPCVLHRHAAALAHHRRARVRGIADEDHLIMMPLLGRHPLDRPAMDLLVAGQRAEILMDAVTKTGKAPTQPIKPTSHRFASPRPGDVAETVGALAAYWAKPEKATITQKKPQVPECPSGGFTSHLSRLSERA